MSTSNLQTATYPQPIFFCPDIESRGHSFFESRGHTRTFCCFINSLEASRVSLPVEPSLAYYIPRQPNPPPWRIHRARLSVHGSPNPGGISHL